MNTKEFSNVDRNVETIDEKPEENDFDKGIEEVINKNSNPVERNEFEDKI